MQAAQAAPARGWCLRWSGAALTESRSHDQLAAAWTEEWRDGGVSEREGIRGCLFHAGGASHGVADSRCAVACDLTIDVPLSVPG